MCSNGIWRKRYYLKLCALLKDVKIRKYIGLTRPRWTGHVMKKEDQELSKTILLSQSLRGEESPDYVRRMKLMKILKGSE